MSKLDDYGRFDADVEIIRTACYPLRVDKVKASHIEAWLEECRASVLLVLYRSDDGKRYLQYLDWNQQQRSESKYPAPDKQVLADAKQMLSSVHLVVVEGVVEVEVVSEGGSVGSAPKNGARHATVPDESPVVLTLPLRNGLEFEVRQSLVTEFDTAYPAVDVPATLREMRAWCIANENKQKTRQGIKRFINSWLQDEQAKHGS